MHRVNHYPVTFAGHLTVAVGRTGVEVLPTEDARVPLNPPGTAPAKADLVGALIASAVDDALGSPGLLDAGHTAKLKADRRPRGRGMKSRRSNTPGQRREAMSCWQRSRAPASVGRRSALVPMLNAVAVPDHAIDINGVPALNDIVVHSDRMSMGNGCARSDRSGIARHAPIFAEALRDRHRQTRNRGTIGGSLCLLIPAASSRSGIVDGLPPHRRS